MGRGEWFRSTQRSAFFCNRTSRPTVTRNGVSVYIWSVSSHSHRRLVYLSGTLQYLASRIHAMRPTPSYLFYGYSRFTLCYHCPTLCPSVAVA